MNKWIGLIALILLLLSPLSHAASKVIILNVNGPIGPATQDYIQRGITYAGKENAAAIVIQLNTPGGLETAMRNINESIITSKVPVISYVTPSGARAASAGTFILYASHVAAMAPGTNLGAASPVAIGGKTKEDKKPDVSETKALNDAAAYIRSLAQLRGRNVNWAESAVRKAESLPAEEAKKLNVINFIAADTTQLLQKANGMTVELNGKPTTIKIENTLLETMATDWRHDFLSFITNPNIAYILLLVAMYGLFFEFASPGAILPGVAGIIALLLVLYAFQLMPINYTGLLLIAVGIGFMIAEVYISSFGVLAVGGAIAFIIGSIMIFDMDNPYYQLTWSLIALMAIITGLFFLVVATLAIRAHKKAIVTGKEALIGSEGIVIEIMNEQIIVRVSGELWEAKSPNKLHTGQTIRVDRIDGLLLSVTPVSKNKTISQE